MAMADQETTIYALPNEAVTHIFTHLDAKTLLDVMVVCFEWYQLANSETLWRGLCETTNRIVGKQTNEWCHDFSMTSGWKKCYYKITTEDLKAFVDPQDICDLANKYEADAARRKYLFCRGLDLFPDSPVILQQCADYYVDRPDDYGSWDIAELYYKRALEESEKDPVKHRKTLLFTVYRYAVFFTTNRRNYTDADKMYRLLLRKLPGNPWVYEKYAEFLCDYRHKYNLGEKIYRLVLNMSASASVLVGYALFLWQVRRNYILAGKCFRAACELDMQKIYVYVNFIGRHMQDESSGKDVLLQSKLFKHVTQHPEDEQKVFSLALAFHQIHCVKEAEELYRKHLTLTDKPNICTLSNLAELLLHSYQSFDEAEQLYQTGLKLSSGYNDTIEVALAGLQLARNNVEQGLQSLYTLVHSSHIQASRNAYTEAWILIYIHCPLDKKVEALTNVKRLLYTQAIRPKLILMFDANILWAKQYHVPHWHWIQKISDVYNCTTEIEALNAWEDWAVIEVPPPTVDEGDDDLNTILQLEDDDEPVDDMQPTVQPTYQATHH